MTENNRAKQSIIGQSFSQFITDNNVGIFTRRRSVCTYWVKSIYAYNPIYGTST